MDQAILDIARQIASNLVCRPYTTIPLTEIRAMVNTGLDVDALTQALNGQEVKCPCGGKDCPGFYIAAEDGTMLVIPTYAAVAKSKGQKLAEYLDDAIVYRDKLINQAIDLFETCWQYFEKDESPPENLIEDIAEEAVAIMLEIAAGTRFALLSMASNSTDDTPNFSTN